MMMPPTVCPKKYWGQHFLQDKNIARKIVDALGPPAGHGALIEIGPGQGVLTDFLVQRYAAVLHLVEVDPALVAALQHAYPLLKDRILEADFLKLALDQHWDHRPLSVIGNLPYNISSPIFFKLLAHRHQVCEVVCMIQQEVAQRVVAAPGSKAYGIPSVLLQAFYDVECLFSVGPQVFYPPPRVQSAVIRLRRNATQRLACDELLFFRLVKAGFRQRRKTLRNAIKALLPPERLSWPVLDRRAEQLSVQDFVALTAALEGCR